MLSLHNVLVFVHVAAVFLMIGGITVQRVSMLAMRSSSPTEVLGAFKTYASASWLIGLAAVVTPLSGLTVAWFLGYTWTALWVSASVGLFVVLSIWREVVLVPQVKLLDGAARQAAADPATHSSTLIAVARHPRLHLGHLGVELSLTAILVLMVFKPMAL